MAILTCPTTVVHASPERIWRLLDTPADFERWADVRIATGRDRPLAPGDHIVFRIGPGGLFTVTFHVLEAEPCRRLAVDVELPFGVVNHETVVIAPISDFESRVTFN